jgi:hypothetical protein
MRKRGGGRERKEEKNIREREDEKVKYLWYESTYASKNKLLLNHHLLYLSTTSHELSIKQNDIQ